VVGDVYQNIKRIIYTLCLQQAHHHLCQRIYFHLGCAFDVVLNLGFAVEVLGDTLETSAEVYARI
jgi:hypothetical protein